MKSIRFICVALAALMLLCSCDTTGVETGKAVTDTGIETETKPGDVTDEPFEGVYITAKEYYNNGYSTDYLVGIDKFGRTFEASTKKTDKDRQVGIFYFLTLGQHLDNKYSGKIYDTSKVLAMENGVNLMFSLDALDEKIAPVGANYFWGEPLFGYYNSADTWVIRRHLTLLASAGVDFLAFDVTNAVTYDSVYVKIMQEICSLKEQGWENVPEVVFYTHSYSTNIINKLYTAIYEKGLYKESWYYYKGKPLIVGYKTPAADKHGTGDDNYKPAALSTEISNFFFIKRAEWPSEYTTYKDSIPWMEWQYPSPVHTDVISVCVAAHPAIPMSRSITRGAENFGRGWSVTENKNISADAERGTYFQSCWDTAIAADTDIVFVTGWNEWVASKFEYEGEYALVDLADMEFSRDCEMMKGGYEDAFLMQLASNIRAYKSTPLGDARVTPKPVTIDMTSDMSKWNNVKSVFRSIGRDNTARSYIGASPSVSYVQDAARNNIYEIRVAQDSENIYFYIKTDDVIAARDPADTGWMNIFIGTGNVSAKGWEGYEYIVNRTFGEGKITNVEKLNADFTSEKTGSGEWFISGNILQVKVPRAAVGLGGVNNFYFKVADGIEHPDDIADYYVSGRSLPMGRFSFRYLG